MPLGTLLPSVVGHGQAEWALSEQSVETGGSGLLADTGLGQAARKAMGTRSGAS